MKKSLFTIFMLCCTVSMCCELNCKDEQQVVFSALGGTSSKVLTTGIISAEEVDEQGDVDLGEMNTKLLEKIEELTLYIIDLQKQIDELKKIERSKL